MRVCSLPLQSASGTKAKSHFGAQSVIKLAWDGGGADLFLSQLAPPEANAVDWETAQSARRWRTTDAPSGIRSTSAGSSTFSCAEVLSREPVENVKSVRRSGMKVLANGGLGRGRKWRTHPPWELGSSPLSSDEGPRRGLAIFAAAVPRVSWHQICTIAAEEFP